ncbi:MAG: cellulase family glycosylhydrolase [Candidatus Kaistia colombiensis]|nr:MAG: cellulase family glycosylhydrolase [Kaistia sp.]
MLLILLLPSLAATTVKASGTEALPIDLLSCQGRGQAGQAGANDRMRFWDTQRRGVNLFDQEARAEQFREAKAAGIDFVRLAVDKWRGAEGQFLIGDLDHYKGLVQADVRTLLEVLDWAEDADMPVVVTMLRLPGAPWEHIDGDGKVQPLWRSVPHWRQAVQFWHDLAGQLSDHPAIVGYNLLNAPTPERTADLDSYDAAKLANWYTQARGTTADLNLFYRCLTDAIRTVDAMTPLLLDAGSLAAPDALSYLEPLPDVATLYSVNDFFPFEYTHQKIEASLQYPGVMEIGNQFEWIDRNSLEAFVSPVADWTNANSIPPSRVIFSAFGVNRHAPGAPQYLNDTLSVLNEGGWHWALYAFRENGWELMDYELGTGPIAALPDAAEERRFRLNALRSRDGAFSGLWQQFSERSQPLRRQSE